MSRAGLHWMTAAAPGRRRGSGAGSGGPEKKAGPVSAADQADGFTV